MLRFAPLRFALRTLPTAVRVDACADHRIGREVLAGGGTSVSFAMKTADNVKQNVTRNPAEDNAKAMTCEETRNT